MFNEDFKELVLLAAAFLMLISGEIQSQNLLNGPESVAYDSLTDCYMVSNVRDGKIIKIKRDGTHEEFISGYGACLGNCISGRILYFTSGFRIYGIDLDTRAEVKNLRIVAATNLDGITADAGGNLYAVETLNKKIFKVNPETNQVTLFTDLPAEEFPQDVIFDKFKNRLLVVSYRAQSPIMEVSLFDSSVSVAMPTNAGRYDGITIDNEGNIYAASHWGTGSVFKFDNDFALPAVLVSGGHNDPAGLDYDPVNNVLAVPEFSGNRVRFVDLNPTGVQAGIQLNEYSISPNYPNPFNPVTHIDYFLPAGSNVSLRIYDIKGEEIVSLINGFQKGGRYSITFDAGNLSSGIYIFKFKADEYYKSQKMILMK